MANGSVEPLYSTSRCPARPSSVTSDAERTTWLSVPRLTGAAVAGCISTWPDPGFLAGNTACLAFEPRAGRTHTGEISVELDVLERMFGVRPGAVSFHQASQVPGGMEIEVRGAVKANLLPGYHFVADPNMSNWILTVLDLFRTRAEPQIQLLVHPMWWRERSGQTPEQLWERAIVNNFERSQEQLLAHEGAYGPRRVFRILPAS